MLSSPSCLSTSTRDHALCVPLLAHQAVFYWTQSLVTMNEGPARMTHNQTAELLRASVNALGSINNHLMTNYPPTIPSQVSTSLLDVQNDGVCVEWTCALWVVCV